MFDNSFYAFLDLIKRINGFFSYDIINKEINDLIKILKKEYSKLKKNTQVMLIILNKKILSHAEAFYMLTLYIHKKLISKKDPNRLKIPLLLIDFLHERRNLDIIVDGIGFYYFKDDFLSKFKEKDLHKIDEIIAKMSICIEKANEAAHKNYFNT